MSDAYQAYGSQSQRALTGRLGEAHVFTEAARLLHDARGTNDRAALVRALKHNLNLWTHVQVELSADNHPMSESLKSDLLALSVFVDRRTAEAIADPDPALVDALVEINRNMAQGQMGGAPNSDA